MTNLELADKLQKESEHFSGAQDLVGMLWDAGAALRNLHTENTALRVTEDNLRQALQECQDQRRAAFRRIEELDRELDAMRAQIGQGVPVATLTMFDIRSQTGTVDLVGDWKELRVGDPLYTHPAPQQKPLLDEKKIEMWDDKYRSWIGESIASAIEAAHGIGEKK